MIFHRSLLREFSSFSLAVFSTLFAVTVTTQLIRLLGQAASGTLVSDAVLVLLGFSALNYLPVLLSLTLFISILMTLSRCYRDSEMIVWFGTGLPLTAWIWPVLVFALPLVMLIGMLSLFLSPWAAGQSDEYRRQMENRDDLSRVAPGVFREASGSERVFFVEAIAGDESRVQNVFITQVENGMMTVTVSKRGIRDTAENGDRFLVLLNGRRYDGKKGNLDFRIMEFERYSLRVESREVQAPQVSTKAASTWALVSDRSNPALGELVWRLGLPLSALNLALLAIPLSFVNPRASRSINLLFALLAYMVYSNFVSIAQAWVSQGRLAFGAGWWSVHAVAAIGLAFLFWRRLHVGGVRRP